MARHARRELVATVTGEDEVRMTVDKAWDDAHTTSVNSLVGDLTGSTNCNNHTSVEND